MSVSGILSSSLFNSNSHRVHDRMQQFRKDFQQLGGVGAGSVNATA
jgi:hypothetical protein